MKSYVVTHQSKVTDLNEGSIIASLLEAFARQIALAYIEVVSNVDRYIRQFAAKQFRIEQKPGIAASGFVVMSAPSNVAERIDIPAGTLIGTASGIQYRTMVASGVEAGTRDSPNIPVLCVVAGTSGNVPAGAISEMFSPIVGIEIIGNPAPIIGGSDEESKSDFDLRFASFIVGLFKSSPSGIRAAVLGVPGVRSVGIQEHFPPEAGYNVTIAAENGAGELLDSTKQAVELAVLGDGTEENPGCLAAGIHGRVISPPISTISVSVRATAVTDFPRAYIEDDLNDKIASHINGLGVGVSVIDSAIREIVARQFGVIGVLELTVTKSAYIDAITIARAGTVAIALENP